MPQARRKTPFSGKAKKQQIQAKKQNKTLLLSTSPSSSQQDIMSMNFQPTKGGGRGGDRNRYALKFYRETNEQVALCKENAFKSLEPVPEKDLEIPTTRYFPESLSFPKRPPWNFNMTPAQLEHNEQKYFHDYVTNLQKSPIWNEISYFELNLETWRQLWRVLEMCDILLLVIDVRYAPCMFPPSLYNHVKEINKSMIVVLNKVDLVPPSVVAAWKWYLTSQYPDLKVVYFTSCPGYNLRGATSDAQGLQLRRRKGRLRMCTEGASQLLQAVREIVDKQVDLSKWERKIKEEAGVEYEEGEGPIVGETIVTNTETSFYAHERYKDGILTIGCVGQPNVGKSSVINSLKGRKVVSVSRTPGHTKHFQTIYLTDNVRLCDCPGLVFPSTVPRPIQILMGSYPIAQLREPYTTIRYLAERLDLPKLLRISHPENDDTWSPRDVCDGWANKRKYFTAKAARLDTYRAANSLLRMSLDGRICLWLRPPGFKDELEKWESCEEVKYVKWVQAKSSETQQEEFIDSDLYSDEENKGDHQHVESDSNDDDDNDDVSDDEAATAAMANKFAALASEDLE